MHSLGRRLIVAAFVAAIASLMIGAVALGQDREVVFIRDKLAPKRLEVPVGTVVAWRNQDDERHRIRSRQGPVEFDSGNLEPGERFSVTFVVAGRYPYIDERNDEDSSYHGTIFVIDDRPADDLPLSEATVTLIDESFQPPTLRVAVGATVTWENIDGDDDHTVTADDGAFNSGVMPAGTAFEQIFEAPGMFPYFCAIHPEMVGTITVVGDAPAQADDVTVESPTTTGTAASGNDDDAAVATAAEPVAATIVDLTFQPSVIEVDAGANVTWTNEDGVPHTVTARTDDFDSGVMQEGATFSQVFDEPGTFDYFCAIHPSMSGSVVVGEPAAIEEAVDPGSDPSAGTDGSVAKVVVVDVAFEPEDIEVPVGTTVDWINDDPFAHTVTANDGVFDSGTMDAGQVFSQTFDEPGTYLYFCAIHPSMTGTVTVSAP